jgi:hypothetical protein
MNNLSIGIGLCFYQDVHSLTRCLYSLQAYPLDHLIAIDGKFKEYPAEGQLSDQRCLDLIELPTSRKISSNNWIRGNGEATKVF